MRDSLWIVCQRCNRGMYANSSSPMVKTRICKMCRTNPSWLTDDMRRTIAAAKPESPFMGLSFKSRRKAHRSTRHNSPVHVAPGQKWISLDPRDHRDGASRHVHVRSVDDGVATVDSYWERGGEVVIRPITRRVKLESFRPTKGRGFRLVGDFDIHFSANPFGVERGQRWRALDPRRNGATIVIEDVHPEQGVAIYTDRNGQVRTIDLTTFRRMKGRGYEQVEK